MHSAFARWIRLGLWRPLGEPLTPHSRLPCGDQVVLPANPDDRAGVLPMLPRLAALGFEPEAVIASFHGMPERTLHLGDPYHCHCQKTARLLSAAMDRELLVTFQSRFGRAKWLTPATDTTLAELPSKGVKKVAILAPGFSADCLETLEELAIRGRETFIEAGGTHFAYLPCLNASGPGVAMLRSLLARELEGWLARS